MNKKLESALKCVEGENYCPRFYKSECECPYDLARAVKRLTRDRDRRKKDFAGLFLLVEKIDRALESDFNEDRILDKAREYAGRALKDYGRRA